MAVTRRLDWDGDEVTELVEAAVKSAIDETTEAAVQHAKSHHKWKNRTGRAEASIQSRRSQKVGNRIEGEFGSYGVDYFRYLELGTSKMDAMPCLRPAEDVEFPKLEERIRFNMHLGGGGRRVVR